MLERFLILWLVLSSGIAYIWPLLFGDEAFDPFSKDVSNYYLSWLIILTMFAIGWMLPRDEVQQVFRRWPTIVFGTGVQYITMPLLAFLLGKAVGLEGDYLNGMIMVGCVPGAMASNVLTLLSRGNASYSVSLTTLATLLSPIAVPLAMRIFLTGSEKVDTALLWAASANLIKTVVIPVTIGHLIGRTCPQWETQARNIGSTFANLAILLIIAIVVGRNRDNLQHLPTHLILALIGLNLGGYLAGYLSGLSIRLPEPMRRALTLEIGMQNAGLGAFLTLKLFEGHEETAIAPALYTFGCMFTGTILARIWARMHERADRDGDEAETESADAQ